MQGPRPLEEVERLPAQAAVVQKPDERVAGGELAPRFPHRVDEVERALGQARALGGVVIADHQGKLLKSPALLVPVAIEPVDRRCPAQQPRRGPPGRPRRARRPLRHAGARPLEVVARAALEGEAGLPQRGPGGVELVREPQRIGEAAAQGARQEIVG
jgi:hypothetical protein